MVKNGKLLVLFEKADEIAGHVLKISFGAMVLWVLLHLDAVIPALKLAFTPILPE